MRAVGEFCVHPGQGVCLVENVVSEPTPAYVLSPIGQKHPVQIVFPLDQEFRLRDLIRSIFIMRRLRNLILDTLLEKVLVKTPLVLLKRLELVLIRRVRSTRNHLFLTREFLRWPVIAVFTSLLRHLIAPLMRFKRCLAHAMA